MNIPMSIRTENESVCKKKRVDRKRVDRKKERVLVVRCQQDNTKESDGELAQKESQNERAALNPFPEVDRDFTHLPPLPTLIVIATSNPIAVVIWVNVVLCTLLCCSQRNNFISSSITLPCVPRIK